MPARPRRPAGPRLEPAASGRARRAGVALAAVAAVLIAGCAPAGLDRQQQQAEVRECASLLERHVTGRKPPGALIVQGQTIDIGRDPAAFYAALLALRGVDAFPIEGGKADTTTRATFVSDLCKAKDASSSSGSTAVTTTSTTTTSTTQPSTPPPAPSTGG